MSFIIEGFIRIEGSLVSVSPRSEYILASTKSPSSVQRIPWPGVHNEGGQEHEIFIPAGMLVTTRLILMKRLLSQWPGAPLETSC
ncbi:hypothetical protein BC835DRAFT_1318330 [Cytidiella melzeri]|nr:hypothetical protein BC835DRAFT_1318330 [Cytidiella melzeri]